MVDNQHQQIKGYRDLSPAEIAMMNEIKEHEERIAQLIMRLPSSTLDQRCLALARTKLQEGFMWAVRAVAKPESAWG